MQFKAQPCILDAEFLLQRIDNALADITEWSDIVGKDFHLNDHTRISFSLNCKKSKNQFCCFLGLPPLRGVNLSTNISSHLTIKSSFPICRKKSSVCGFLAE
jgi:hypothetical protein